jgi:hypothetical protein
MHRSFDRRRTRAFAVVILLLAAAAGTAALGAGGCGGPSEAQAAFEQYLEDVRPALDDSLGALDTMAAAFETAGQTNPPDFATAARGCSEAAAAWTSARDAAAACSPPADLEQANASLVESLALEADLYGAMGTVLAQIGDSLSDRARLDELMAELNELQPEKVGQTVKEKTAAWTDAVEQTARELEIEPPQWLTQWIADLESAGQRLEDL